MITGSEASAFTVKHCVAQFYFDTISPNDSEIGITVKLTVKLMTVKLEIEIDSER